MIERQVDPDRDDQATQPGQHRQRQPPPLPQLTHVELAPGLQPEHEEKNVISPLFTHSRRSSDTPAPASCTDSRAPHTASYDDALTLIHTSAATVIATSTAALPVSVRKNTRSGVCRLLAHAVRPDRE